MRWHLCIPCCTHNPCLAAFPNRHSRCPPPSATHAGKLSGPKNKELESMVAVIADAHDRLTHGRMNAEEVRECG